MLPAGPYNEIWDRASRSAVVDATLSGQGVTSHNRVFNVVDLPAGQPLPPGSTALPSRSIQARVELPWLRTLGPGMGLLMGGGGVLTAYGGMQETVETGNPAFATLGVLSGALEGTGGAAYAIGALGASGEMMAAGTAVAETGGLLAMPLVLWFMMRMNTIDADNQRLRSSEAQKLRAEGYWLGAAIVETPPALQ